MKCPYCAEEIKDEALFCRHCQHDLGLVKPLLARISSLEREPEISTPAMAPNFAASSYEKLAVGIAVVLGIILTSGYFFLTHKQEDAGNQLSAIFAIAFPPVALGLLIGLPSSRLNPPALTIFGFALGTLNFVFIWLMLHNTKGGEFQTFFAFITLVIGQSITFITFGFLCTPPHRGWPLSQILGKLKVNAKPLSANLLMLVDIIKSLIFLGTTIAFVYL